MSRALSVDLRVRVLAAVACGLTHRQAAERFGASAASVSRWRKRVAAHVRNASLTNLTGEHRPKPVPPEPNRSNGAV
jgi:transposase